MTVILVSGALAKRPFNGGGAWVRLSWVRGLARLGFHVVFVETIDEDQCVDEHGRRVPFEASVNLARFREVTDGFGMTGSCALVLGEGERTYGLAWQELLDLAGEADLLLDISGQLRLEALRRRPRRRAFLDLDPGFSQCWHATGVLPIAEHDLYFTIGENIGRPRCPIPTDGIRWRPTRQPVVLEDWPVAAGGDDGRLTTVASWRGAYGPIELDGRTLGVKVHEFRKFMALPGRARQRFEIALDIHDGDRCDRQALVAAGWRLADPRAVAGDPWRFRDYVAGSGGEFSVAQGVYVETESGWFSDRTVRYLASGLPALVQDTGFSAQIPVGTGLLAFRTPEEAIAGAEAIADDPRAHREAARAIAERHFDSDIVLARFAQDAELAP